MSRATRQIIGSSRPIVIMYHRVDSVGTDPWELAVSPGRFARQIALLRRQRQVVPLSWLAAELASGRLPARTAAVTFDDGYGDVYRNALPILEAEGCPATVFITTGAIGSKDGFWWDQLSRIVYETPSLPVLLRLPSSEGNQEICFGLAGEALDRDMLHRRLHGLLKEKRTEERQEALEHLSDWAGVELITRHDDLAMSLDDLVLLASSKLIEIGAHTVSHPSMPLLSAGELEREVVTSRRQCEEMTGREVTGFAYPFGDHTVASTAAVRAAGFKYACTTVSREVRSTDNALTIPRLCAADWNEADFQRRVLVHG